MLARRPVGKPASQAQKLEYCTFSSSSRNNCNNSPAKKKKKKKKKERGELAETPLIAEMEYFIYSRECILYTYNERAHVLHASSSLLVESERRLTEWWLRHGTARRPVAVAAPSPSYRSRASLRDQRRRRLRPRFRTLGNRLSEPYSRKFSRASFSSPFDPYRFASDSRDTIYARSCRGIVLHPKLLAVRKIAKATLRCSYTYICAFIVLGVHRSIPIYKDSALEFKARATCSNLSVSPLYYCTLSNFAFRSVCTS